MFRSPGNGLEHFSLGQNAQQMRRANYGIGRKRVSLQQILLEGLFNFEFRTGLGVPFAFGSNDGSRQRRITDHRQPQLDPSSGFFAGSTLVLESELGHPENRRSKLRRSEEGRGERGEGFLTGVLLCMKRVV